MLVEGWFGLTVAVRVKRYTPLMMGRDNATSKKSRKEANSRKKDEAEIILWC
jgi:hypothetical protein